MGQEVLARLKALQMTGDDVELYIAAFENLMRQARCKREGGLMVDYFRRGLPFDLQLSIIKRGIPDIID
jgi:hypothetical protein